MKQSTARFFLCASLLFGLLAVSCSPEVLSGFRKSTSPVSITQRPLVAPCIGPGASFFNMQIDFGKKHFSGMLISKRLADTTYRVVFTSHFGMSIFDFELTPRTFIVHYCMEAMDKDKVKNVLRDDLRALFLLDIPKQYKQQRYVNKNNANLSAYKLEGDGRKLYFAFDIQGNLVKQARKSSLFTTNFTYSDCTRDTSGVVNIQHKPINLRFTLERLEVTEEQVKTE